MLNKKSTIFIYIHFNCEKQFLYLHVNRMNIPLLF